ncbi:hypothetical protein VOLCADRAFT_90013 [Volvox carteri f. nagariensis]|uniref:Uncharacterized protein n=1 Tax=Volvox carteri f. nagariensis TaxID=3068 RepID=D8TT94_VOLCA|nr:uncharacterized protein VOLCADRAFT_90013 [Volvox carteri f. nagariensis]EFJ49158.1 hypothetical protein VOLCADRAFT_90013 [Volvox carteri f. nagariensis]|eukprot:XP_002949606.1 hypothetical protein VOLCADRAFT_90013 [Volvox carteri f. nagariensis]
MAPDPTDDKTRSNGSGGLQLGHGSSSRNGSSNSSGRGASGDMALHEREPHVAASTSTSTSASGHNRQHHHHHQQIKQQQPQQGVPQRRRHKGQEQQQQQQQQRTRPPGGAAQGRAASGRRSSSSKTYGNDIGAIDNVEDGEDEDEDGGEFLDLSEEDLEELVFASARAGGQRTEAAEPEQSAAAEAVAAPPAGKQGRQQRAGGGAAAAAATASATAAVAVAGLPSEVEALVMAAVRSGSVSNDGAILADQLRQLQAAAAAAATAGNGGGIGSSATATATADTLRASVTALADLLDCDAEAAAAVLLNYPRFIGVLFSGGVCGGGDGGLERLRSFAGMLKLDLAEARDIVRRNPALLLAPYEPLRQKLVALANATGLSLAQATAMVTTYMFPEL